MEVYILRVNIKKILINRYYDATSKDLSWYNLWSRKTLFFKKKKEKKNLLWS